MTTQAEAMGLSVQDKPTIEIGGMKYTITLLNTTRAYITGQEVIKLTAPIAGAAFDGMRNDAELLIDESHTFQAVAIHLKNQMGEVDTLAIIIELLNGVTVDGVPLNFDSHFPGRLDHLLQLVEFALEENYSSLFIGTSLRERLQIFMRRFQTPVVASEEDETSNESET